MEQKRVKDRRTWKGEREGTEIDPSDRAVSSDGVRGGSDADFHDFGIDGCVAV